MADEFYICEVCFERRNEIVTSREHGTRRQHGSMQCQKCRCNSFVNPAEEVRRIVERIANLAQDRIRYDFMVAAIVQDQVKNDDG